MNAAFLAAGASMLPRGMRSLFIKQSSPRSQHACDESPQPDQGKLDDLLNGDGLMSSWRKSEMYDNVNLFYDETMHEETSKVMDEMVNC